MTDPGDASRTPGDAAPAETRAEEVEPPSAMRLRLDADQLNAFLRRVFGPVSMSVRHAEPGRVTTAMTTTPAHLRPGGIVSGPTLMTLADVAAYVAVIAHVGDQPMAVTSSLTMHFLAGAAPGELYAQARLLKLGRRLATSEVELWTIPGRIAAHATLSTPCRRADVGDRNLDGVNEFPPDKVDVVGVAPSGRHSMTSLTRRVSIAAALAGALVAGAASAQTMGTGAASTGPGAANAGGGSTSSAGATGPGAMNANPSQANSGSSTTGSSSTMSGSMSTMPPSGSAGSASSSPGTQSGVNGVGAGPPSGSSTSSGAAASAGGMGTSGSAAGNASVGAAPH